MKIEKIKKLKNGKYKLTFDSEDTLVTYDDVIINKMLFNGKEVNNETLSEISINKDFILIGILYFYRFPYFLLIPYLLIF